MFCLPPSDRETIRKIHNFPRAERINSNICFIERFTSEAKELTRDSHEINVTPYPLDITKCV